MASRREEVTLAGHLEGMGLREHCQVRATKVSLRGTDMYEYERPVIFDAPADLPHGVYTLTFDGRSIPTQHVSPGWVSPNQAFLRF